MKNSLLQVLICCENQQGEGYEFRKEFCSGPNLGRFQCRDKEDCVEENEKSVLRYFYCRVFHFSQGSYGCNCMRVCQLSFSLMEPD